MIVLEHGKNYHEASCPFCKCKIGYLNRDVYCERGFDRKHQGYLTCPECSSHIYVWGRLDDSCKFIYKLPNHIQERDAIMLPYKIVSPY